MKKLTISGKYSDLEVLIDAEDMDLLLKYKWWIARKQNNYMMVYTQVKRKTIPIHRLIMGAKPGQIIDHINRNPLDNRKVNLRFCSARQNCFNTGFKPSNTSGVIGVDYRKDRMKWRATVRINGVKKALGHFDTKEQAEAARLEAELKYYGEFSPKYKENK